MPRALFSSYDKTGTENFARFLSGRGYEILSTGGTFRYLKEKGIKVTEVSDITHFPEVLDGRVKTLHPAVHAGILAMRGKASHMEQLKAHAIEPIDFVVVNLYPFEATASNPDSSLAEIIEQIDIGGVALIRAAAKNHTDVSIVVDVNDLPLLQEEIEAKGTVSAATKLTLAAKAFSHTAYYDSLISTYFNRLSGRKFPNEAALPLKMAQGLRYGENPHQEAVLYRSYIDPNVSTLKADILWGKEMSYNNFLDADACLDIIREFTDDEPFCAIIKHTNPSGAAFGNSLSDAFDRAKACDPVSAFGGIVGFNRALDAETAAKIGETFFEIVIAPDYDPKALETLKAKKNLRILKLNGNDYSKAGLAYRRIEGGVLAQDWDGPNNEYENWKPATKRTPGEAEARDLEFAWKIAKYVKSNAIVYVKNRQTIGVGAGQMSRVDSARIGAWKAREFGFDVKGSVIASDAFFPFRDTVDNAAKEGVTAIVQPGGSMRDEESVTAAEEAGIAMVFTGARHFRH